ncbi:Regucalcin [Folsomia candida]|uniref:Regucalcin n=1 Tax=Folsomia candida TaxID=158441 RepID=A0A226DGV5_FOLCA|nr:Regucalcin [Folsomia candida]
MEYSLKVAPGSVKCFDGLGEGAHWDAEKEELLYVDLTGQAVFLYVPKSKECYRLQIDDGWVPAVVPVRGEAQKYLISIGRTLNVMEWDGMSERAATLKTVHTVDQDAPTINWLNDGKCDSSGRFWTGTIGPYSFETGKADPNLGTLYCLGNDGKLTGHLSGIDFSNGLTWSPDNCTMYYNDSYSTKLAAFDFDVTDGSNRRIVFDFEANNTAGFPDGMTTDSDGNLWISMFSGEGVIKVDPKVGKQIGCVKIPTKRATCPTFGGKNLEILYVTTAGAFMPTEKASDIGPDAGALFQVENIGVKGCSQGGVSYAGNNSLHDFVAKSE